MTSNLEMDSSRLRWLVTVSVLPWIVGLALFRGAALNTGWNMLAPLFGLLVTLYFGHLLLFRLQCSLLEWLTGSILLASMEGLLLSTPGVLSNTGFVLLIAPALAAWIFFAVIRALVTARLLRMESSAQRMLWILLHAALLLSPAAVVAGLAIYLGGYVPMLSGSEFTPYGLPLFAAGSVGLAVNFHICHKAKQAARQALAERGFAAVR